MRSLNVSAWTRAGVRVAAIAVACTLAAASAAEAQLSGAVFTTESVCDGTNVNIFGSKEEVYLDGGPRKEGSAGLPNGFYYVRVTEPNGTLLGYTTSASVEVAGGEFVTCYQLWAILVKASDGTQGYDTTGNNGGEYKVWASQNPGFPNSASKTDNFKVLEGEPPCDPDTDPDCELPDTGAIEACKYYDLNTDGVRNGDPIEVGIEGWLMTLSDTLGPLATAFTGSDGCVTFEELEDGDYTVTEGTPVETNWVHTSSTSINVSVTAPDTEFAEFGNVCLGAGGGRTLGFWSNRNGQALFGADDLALMVALNLRKADGTHFNPASYTEFRTWLLSATATNMAYMLSAQLAAMALNVHNGFVDGSALIYAPGTLSANVAGFATVNDIINEANAALGVNGLILAGNPQRTYYEDLKNALDNANNNQTFVQPGPCPFSFPID